MNVGAIAGNGLLQLLSRLIGKGRAAWYAITGEFMSAEEALALGVVNKEFPAESLLDKSKSFLENLMAKKTQVALWHNRKSLSALVLT